MDNLISKLKTDPTCKVEKSVPENQINYWKQDWKKSYEIENCLSHEDLEWLTDLMYRDHTKRRVKKNGTLHFWVNNEKIKKKFYDKWIEYIPELDYNAPWEGNFVITSTPYNLHIDTGRSDWVLNNECIPSKQMVIPLYVCHTNKTLKEEEKPEAGIAIFKNRFIRYGTNFCKDDTKYETDVFDSVYNYSNLVCYNENGKIWNVDWKKPFDKELRNKYFDHYKEKWLEGFELENIYNYNRGNIIVFDRCQAHSGINFQKNKVTLKAMLALMTTKKIK